MMMKNPVTKKLLSVILATVLVFTILTATSLTAFAAGTGDLSFDLNENGDGYILTECDWEASGSLTIPSTYKGLPVTEIGDYSFAFCYYITSVKIPESVTAIGEAAFLSCSRLTSLTVPKSVTSIGACAFGYYYDPDNEYFLQCGSNYSISGYTYSAAHEYCVMYDVTFKSIGKADPVTYTLNEDGTGYALTHFSLAYNVDSYDIPKNYKGLPIVEIGDAAFAGCTNLELMTMPDTVVRIGDYAFYGCEKLWWEHFSENVESIGYGAFCETRFYNNEHCWENGVFYYEEYLVEVDPETVSTSVDIKEGTKVICDFAFMGCEDIEQVNIPGSVKNIGLGAFMLCISIENVEIGYGVEKIGDGAFYACDALKKVTVPETVTEIGEVALGWTYDEYSESLDDVLVEGFEIDGFEGTTAEKYAKENGIKFNAITITLTNGDANGDGKINLKDILVIRQYLANYDYTTNTSTVEVEPGADVNGDGVVNLRDVIILRQYMANYNYSA